MNKEQNTENKDLTATFGNTMLYDSSHLKEGDLVMIRLSTDFGYTNTWWRVMFIDLNETFIGRLDKFDKREFTTYKQNEDVCFDINKIQHIYKNGEQFCYSDDTIICDCVGLCRNK